MGRLMDTTPFGWIGKWSSHSCRAARCADPAVASLPCLRPHAPCACCSSATDRGRFSFMGGRGGPLWQQITYTLPTGLPSTANPGTVTVEDAQGRITQRRTLWWPYLEQLLLDMRCAVEGGGLEALPFDFWGGLVGYLGYELKSECGGSAAHHSWLPDAAVFLADRCNVGAAASLLAGVADMKTTLSATKKLCGPAGWSSWTTWPGMSTC